MLRSGFQISSSSDNVSATHDGDTFIYRPEGGWWVIIKIFRKHELRDKFSGRAGSTRCAVSAGEKRQRHVAAGFLKETIFKEFPMKSLLVRRAVVVVAMAFALIASFAAIAPAHADNIAGWQLNHASQGIPDANHVFDNGPGGFGEGDR